MRLLFLFVFLISGFVINAQSKPPASSSAVLQQLKKLEVFGSVLYVAAHPDDENTRLLSYLANERLFRTGYVSMTRGDGGQNLIGDEQGIDLGLIRTQELLAARRIDGAQQFFTRAYDFGYSKSPDETMKIWDKEKILSDLVWIIRRFKPDVIITRFPTTGEGGHGHHTASAILASEAFDAAADANRFQEHFAYGVGTWAAKRLLWNAFNFGNNNLTREDQFKLDVGGYNAVLGRSYGEMAAESRSKHKSQGFGVASQRGSSFEYFVTLKGPPPVYDIMDGIETSASRLTFSRPEDNIRYQEEVKKIIRSFDVSKPAASVPALLSLQKLVTASLGHDGDYSLKMELNRLITTAAGIYMEATAANQVNAAGDSALFQLTFNNRTGVNIDKATAFLYGKAFDFNDIKSNVNSIRNATVIIPEAEKATQPYWLEAPMQKGSFTVNNQNLIGMPDAYPHYALYRIIMDSVPLDVYVPVQFKSTDPVKGETYQPVQIVDPVFITTSPSLLIFNNNKKNERKEVQVTLQANISVNDKAQVNSIMDNKQKLISDSVVNLNKGVRKVYSMGIHGNNIPPNSVQIVSSSALLGKSPKTYSSALNRISYEHIPDILYNYTDETKIIKMDLKTAGARAGYIAGAGDKIPEALQQMGYKVTVLQSADITTNNLKQFDVIITGVRAYNVHTWLSDAYPVLMQYVKDGGVLFTQYNTNNSVGPFRAKISPYPFTISRNRITDETAQVNFLMPSHPALNFPNKITAADFDGWIQERSIYHAENIDTAYDRILSMKDPGEKEHDGSLIISKYGRGKFVYTGIVFFRELPAGVPGAYRLFANLIANPRLKK